MEQQNAHIRHPSAEVAARETVGELVQHRDRRDRDEDETETLEAHDVHEAENELAPVRDEHPQSRENRDADEADE